MLASEGAELTFGMLDQQAIAQASCEEILQREYVAAAASRIPGPGTYRAFFHELVGRQKLCRRDRKKRSQKNSHCRPLDRSLCSVSFFFQAEDGIRDLRGG